jgi:hypothetical protein
MTHHVVNQMGHVASVVGADMRGVAGSSRGT